MTSVPDRASVRLTGISSRAYEHPADRSALVALRKLSGFDVLLSKLFGLINERALRLTFLAGAVKVSERQFPHIHALVRDGAYILDLPDVPECYVIQSPIVNAMAIGRTGRSSCSPPAWSTCTTRRSCASSSATSSGTSCPGTPSTGRCC